MTLTVAYRVVSCRHLYELDDLVNNCITEGWTPIGGITVDRWTTTHHSLGYVDDHTQYHQAMVLNTTMSSKEFDDYMKDPNA